jgi:hypothetical protein
MNIDTDSLLDQLNQQVNSERGSRGKWPAFFDYKIEKDCITLQTNEKFDKSGYRCLDSWGFALFHYVKTKHNMAIKELKFIINNSGGQWTPNAEAFKRRLSYLNINNHKIDFKALYA